MALRDTYSALRLDRMRWVLGLFAAIWIVQGINLLTGDALNHWFGLLPRSVGGLDGILFMPLLHGSVAHAAANSLPLLVLGSLLAATAPGRVLQASAVIVLLGGLGVWLLGSTAIHVGASGLIFGWSGYLVVRGIVEKRTVPILVAVGVVLLYGPLAWSVLPGQPGVSWESHLFGALAGATAAIWLRTA